MSLSRTGVGVAALALTGLSVLGLQSPASAAPGDCPVGQHYAPRVGCVGNGASVDHRNFNPGGKGVVTAYGFRAGSAARVYLDSKSTLLATTAADGAGKVAVEITMPAVSAGDHQLLVAGTAPDGAPLLLGVPVTVSARVTTVGSTSSGSGAGASTSTSSSSSLPRTGTEIGLVAAAGVALVGAGAGASVVGRRRRATT